MVDITKHRMEYDFILNLPEIGPNTAVCLITEISDVTRFANHN